jgi:endoglucanase
MDFDLLKKLTDAPGIPGREEAVGDIIKTQLLDITKDISIDGMGNIIARVPGKGPKLLIDAHMDEVGLMAQYIDPQGFIRFVPVGGIDPKTMLSSTVNVWTCEGPLRGVICSMPPHLKKSDAGNGVSFEELFIDLGLPADKSKEKVMPGDPVTFTNQWHENPYSVQAKSLDDRLGIFVMLEAMKNLTKTGCELYLCASVQEEMGLRGAGPIARKIEPDIVIALEGTVANDLPGVPPHKTLACLGKGPEIRLCDAKFVAHRKLCDFLIGIASRQGIPFQVVVKKAGATNAASFQVDGIGAKAAAVSVPVRYIHSGTGIAWKDDIKNTVRLLKAFLKEIHTWDEI